METIESIQVSSSNIEAIGYMSGNLIVQFKNGTKYMYKNVPVRVFEQFTTAESKGRFLNAYIKSNFECDRLQ